MAESLAKRLKKFVESKTEGEPTPERVEEARRLFAEFISGGRAKAPSVGVGTNFTFSSNRR
jgi:hypothetical protein